MVFTERQKTELLSIVKQTSEKIVSEILNDNNFLDSLAKKVADIVSQKIDERIVILETKIEAMGTQLKDVQTEKDELCLKLDQLEQEAKLSQLRLYGLPEDSSDIKSKVSGLVQEKFNIPNINIERCYRIGKRKNSKSSNPRPIIIQFSSLSQRNLVFFGKKNLKNTKLVIVEELTQRRYNLLMLAKDKIGRDKVWTIEGKIFANINGNKTVLKTEEDIIRYGNK